MNKVLNGLLGKISREYTAKKTTPTARTNPPKNNGDFRAVEIAPSVACCKAAKHAMGRRYLLRAAPRLPLMGCTMPTKCSCRFLKNADRRESDRRLFGATETNRWFAGRENRGGRGRRSSEK